jgi:hypothetical protein
MTPKTLTEEEVDALFENPSLRLLVKLGSIAVHVDEMLSPKGHDFDRTAIKGLLNDAKVKEWIKAGGAFLPVKR